MTFPRAFKFSRGLEDLFTVKQKNQSLEEYIWNFDRAWAELEESNFKNMLEVYLKAAIFYRGLQPHLQFLSLLHERSTYLRDLPYDFLVEFLLVAEAEKKTHTPANNDDFWSDASKLTVFLDGEFLFQVPNVRDSSDNILIHLNRKLQEDKLTKEGDWIQIFPPCVKFSATIKAACFEVDDKGTVLGYCSPVGGGYHCLTNINCNLILLFSVKEDPERDAKELRAALMTPGLAERFVSGGVLH
ncbi:unnamed protein product [Linum trigynum]|uniref:Retrotransposon gag domain-containing protein n=1 Tax=Linum trigynum TaxID=586398 RepID=A0AAV2CVP8_9ROSI